ncbi:MAG: ribosome biogenesis GTPase Der [Planctomycetes bacterium]|nr:ribosome biogenesis GTPase Der [Planctomycetota bacterium]
MPPEDVQPSDDATRAPHASRTWGTLPRFVIVGRPNVGKSTLFNALVGQRISIEDPMAGVTRDRVSFVVQDEGRAFELIDTGGIGLFDEVQLKVEVERQIGIALDLADVILFVVDAKANVSPQDKEIAQRLRRLGRPVRLIVNKVEARADELAVGDAWGLGFGDPIPISAKERMGVLDLREELLVDAAARGGVLPAHDGDDARVDEANGGDVSAPDDDESYVDVWADADAVPADDEAEAEAEADEDAFDEDTDFDDEDADDGEDDAHGLLRRDDDHFDDVADGPTDEVAGARPRPKRTSRARDRDDPRDDRRDPDQGVRLAIVGRPNVGKSTLVNALVGQSRVIVSEIAGTTRDSVDVPFIRGGRAFVAIDTAGIRKRSTVSDSVEFYGQARAEQSIRRSDVALLMLDATAEIGRIDRQIGGMIADRALPCILVVNKWDLARDTATVADYEDYLRNTLRHMAHAPIAFLSATEQLNVDPTLALAAELHDQAGQRVTTGTLNRVVRQAWDVRRPRPYKGRVGKIYYASQIGVHPPRIVLFVNDPELFEGSWRRFLEHRLQEDLPFPDVPVRLFFERSAGSSG